MEAMYQYITDDYVPLPPKKKEPYILYALNKKINMKKKHQQ